MHISHTKSGVTDASWPMNGISGVRSWHLRSDADDETGIPHIDLVSGGADRAARANLEKNGAQAANLGENGILAADSPNVPRQSGRVEALDRTSVAEMSATLIDKMTHDELVRVIGGSNLPTLRRADLQDRLPFYDRDTLLRLAHVARRCCQNQGY